MHMFTEPHVFYHLFTVNMGYQNKLLFKYEYVTMCFLQQHKDTRLLIVPIHYRWNCLTLKLFTQPRIRNDFSLHFIKHSTCKKVSKKSCKLLMLSVFYVTNTLFIWLTISENISLISDKMVSKKSCRLLMSSVFYVTNALFMWLTISENISLISDLCKIGFLFD
jgi:hypothetical protein